jgi:HAD superfamily phosphatase (TIGR01668 family)
MMSLSILPARLFQRYSDLTPAFLRQQGVRLLLCDLDFTLSPKCIHAPDAALRQWVASLKDAGITVMLLSNSYVPTRVEVFRTQLDIPALTGARKPSSKGVARALALAHCSAGETALLGDKLLTDMLCANRSGIRGWMVEPLGGAVGPGQKILHALQAPFKAACRRRERRSVQ